MEMDYPERTPSALKHVEKHQAKPYLYETELEETEQAFSTIRHILSDMKRNNPRNLQSI